MYIIEAMSMLENVQLEKKNAKPEIWQLCQGYGGFLVETQQQALQLLCTSFVQTILGNVGQPKTINTHPQTVNV